VKAQPETPSAVSATVEPASSDDWEVVEQNAAFMEEQLLNQARCSGPRVLLSTSVMQWQDSCDDLIRRRAQGA